MSVRSTVRLASAVRPPTELLSRLRWFFLLFGFFFLVTFVPQVTVQSSRPWPVGLVVVVLMAALGLWWWRCYVHRRFPPAGLLLEGAAYAACVLTPDDPFKALGLLYIAVNFRSLYGSGRQVLVSTSWAVAAFVTALVLAPHLGSLDRVSLLAYTLPGVPVLSVIAHLVALASERAQRAAARERLLSRTGVAIAEARDSDGVRREGLAALTHLLADVPGASADLAGVGDPDPAPATGTRVVVPLHSQDGPVATLRVDSDDPLPPEVEDALSVLAVQLGLGLANTALAADLRHRAGHDPLTDLANRATLTEHLRDALQPGRRDGVAVVVLDLDGFKQVNDTLGHAAGDELLRVVADRLRAQVRDGDLVARLGGDEFVVVLAGTPDPAGAATSAERLLTAVRCPVLVRDRQVRVGASIGLAVHRTGSGTGAEQLLDLADAAMYQAKRSGRGRVCRAPEADARADARGDGRAQADGRAVAGRA